MLKSISERGQRRVPWCLTEKFTLSQTRTGSGDIRRRRHLDVLIPGVWGTPGRTYPWEHAAAASLSVVTRHPNDPLSLKLMPPPAHVSFSL